MARMKATYHAPEGDLRVIEWNGVTFFDGLTVDLNSDEHEEIMRKVPRNQFFSFEMVEGEDEAPKTKRRPGRPPKAEVKPESTDEQDEG